MLILTWRPLTCFLAQQSAAATYSPTKRVDQLTGMEHRNKAHEENTKLFLGYFCVEKKNDVATWFITSLVVTYAGRVLDIFIW